MYNLRFSLGSVTHFMGETKIRNQTDIFFLEHSELNKREWSSKLVGRKGRGGGEENPRLSVFGW